PESSTTVYTSPLGWIEPAARTYPPIDLISPTCFPLTYILVPRRAPLEVNVNTTAGLDLVGLNLIQPCRNVVQNIEVQHAQVRLALGYADVAGWVLVPGIKNRHFRR